MAFHTTPPIFMTCCAPSLRGNYTVTLRSPPQQPMETKSTRPQKTPGTTGSPWGLLPRIDTISFRCHTASCVSLTISAEPYGVTKFCSFWPSPKSIYIYRQSGPKANDDCTIKNKDVNNQIDGLVQDCSNSSALAMELMQSCTKPSKYIWRLYAKND